MACIDYNAAKNYFVDGDETNIILARFHNSADGSSRTPWPAGEIDENASRYLDFAITAPAAMDVRITRIAMEIASDGTSTMCYHLNTGFGDEFTGVTTIYEKRNMTSRVIEHVDLTPTLTIPAGEVLHVRILPWHDYGEVKDSKYIGLRNVRIEGMAFESGEEGIEEVQNKVQSTKYKGAPQRSDHHPPQRRRIHPSGTDREIREIKELHWTQESDPHGPLSWIIVIHKPPRKLGGAVGFTPSV